MRDGAHREGRSEMRDGVREEFWTKCEGLRGLGILVKTLS